jgi:hypothetical protein
MKDAKKKDELLASTVIRGPTGRLEAPKNLRVRNGETNDGRQVDM